MNSAEGGGCTAYDKKLLKKLRRIRFFGHDDEKNIVEDGMNAKMTEVHAALGIVNLRYFNDVLKNRRDKYQRYLKHLEPNNKIQFQSLSKGANFSYFPIILENEKKLLEIQNLLMEQNIYSRRYFYPALNTMTNIVKYKKVPVSEDISKRILCLPLYNNLSNEEIDLICLLINKNLT